MLPVFPHQDAQYLHEYEEQEYHWRIVHGEDLPARLLRPE